MVTKTIFRKIGELDEDLQRRIQAVHDENSDLIRISEKCLILIDQCVVMVKEMIVDHHFDSIGEEVHFFKKLKPQLISKFMYYSTVLDLESHRPTVGHKILKKYYEQEQEKLNQFYQENAEFYSYYRRDATYLDHKIFIRNSYDLKMKLSFGFYNFDRNFTTSHDHLIAHFIANQQLDEFLKNEIVNLSDGKGLQSPSPLVWSASKSGLVELVYGLYQMRCFNGGNIELSEVVKFVEKSLGTDLGNFHKTIFEIRNRKQGPTKFMQMINDNLIQHFLEKGEGEL